MAGPSALLGDDLHGVPLRAGRMRYVGRLVNRSRPCSVLRSKDRSSWQAGALTATCQPHFRVQPRKADRKGSTVRRKTRAVLTLAAMVSTVTALAVVAASPASATYRPP